MSEQKVVVITGGSGGLGRALVDVFHNAGWDVVATGRSDRPSQFAKEILYYQFDAANAADSESFWKQISDKYPKAHFCLINNAGSYVGGGFQQATPDDFEQQMRSNYFAAVYMTRGLVAATARARIINVISSNALTPHTYDAAYGASKAAEMYFFQTIQQEFEPAQYQITNLYPSAIAASNAISFTDLATFIREQAEQTSSYYLRDVTLYPQ